ncbi:MAG: TonB-dependent receptor [Boseongicola sp.]|nr:MAG: TonB-dependent receptor [Boseongicola sp.]
MGTVFLVIGLFIGMYMGGSGDHSLAASHAHINLLGFVLSVVFALTYKSFPAMAEGRLASIHFWAHAAGAVVLNVMLFLLLSDSISEAAMVPLAPISELLVLIGVLIFGWNVLKHAH